MSTSGTRTERALAVGLLVVAVLYLSLFVRRGWFPHDEGMIGQSAERVLLGEIPHVDYDEPYTGLLTWLYAVVFRTAGIDLVHIRWLLFAAAALTQLVVYSILRRYLPPVAAAVGTCLALLWSFPNYFAGLPSWWVLICALLALWALMRYADTHQLRYVAMAGLFVGLATAIKQTGAYLMVPLLMAAWSTPAPRRDRTADRLVREGLAFLPPIAMVFIMRERLLMGEIAYLLIPIAATAVAFRRLGGETVTATGSPSPWRAVLLAAATASLPIAILLLPYITGGHLTTFLHGAFVLPQRRLAFASAPMPSAPLFLLGFLLAATFVLPGSPGPRALRIVKVIRFAIAAALSWWALRENMVYQLVWQSSRALASVLPLLVAGILTLSDRVKGPDRQMLLVSSSILAWAALVQFPFGAPIYFCYVAPLAVICGAVLIHNRPGFVHLHSGPPLVLLILFAVLSMNRGFPGSLGEFHAIQTLDARLNLPRAHLTVSRADVNLYRRITFLVTGHIAGGTLVAGPDCPEVYFLSGQRNPSRTLFDFFTDRSATSPGTRRLSDWTGASVVVLNHRPSFSPPLSDQLVKQLRSEFPYGQVVERLEVRWRLPGYAPDSR